MYTSKPAAAINVPATHMKRASPTEPDKAKIPDGVAKIPVPIILLMILPVSSFLDLVMGRLGLQEDSTSQTNGLSVVRHLIVISSSINDESVRLFASGTRVPLSIGRFIVGHSSKCFSLGELFCPNFSQLYRCKRSSFHDSFPCVDHCISNFQGRYGVIITLPGFGKVQERPSLARF